MENEKGMVLKRLGGRFEEGQRKKETQSCSERELRRLEKEERVLGKDGVIMMENIWEVNGEEIFVI